MSGSSSRHDLRREDAWPQRSLASGLALLLLAFPLPACEGGGGTKAGSVRPPGEDAGIPGDAAVDGGADRGMSTAAFARAVRSFDRVLATGARGGCVDFAGLAADAAARAALKQTLDALAAVHPEALPGAEDRLAFWLDAYHACLIDGLLGGLAANPAYDLGSEAYVLLHERRCRLADGLLSLDEIEQGVLRGAPGYGLETLHGQVFTGGLSDPRIHAALWLGTRSGPPLGPTPYIGEGLAATLDRRATRWLDDPRRGAGPDGISHLFFWYASDFAVVGGAAAFIARHRSAGLPAVDTTRYLPFRWELDRWSAEAAACREPEPEPCRPAEETCNGLDDDCDGEVDEDVVPPRDFCGGAGLCAQLVPRCAGPVGWTCPTLPELEEVETRCDGLDNDCDGRVDEDLDPAGVGCNRQGICADAPPPVCEGVAGWNCQTPAGYENPEHSCDGLDNDCNGVIDDVASPPPGLCLHLGVCAGTAARCEEGSWRCEYPESYEPDVETLCDGLDNDCDGVTDESVANCGCPNLETRPCGLDEGRCMAGIQRCWGGAWMECSGLDPIPETCNGVDDDCDGVTDEGVPGCECRPWQYEPCGVQAGRCYPGWRRCSADGVWGPCEGGRQPEPEVCDGWDNDCDEMVDEPEDLVPPEDFVCRTEGICADFARPVCLRWSWTCLYPPGFEPVERSCDGLDNDCDGEVDEGVLLPATSTLPHPVAWDDEQCWAAGDWEGPDGCCPPRFRVARCTPAGFVACCLFEICGDPEGRDDDCDGRPDAEQCGGL